jgi:hypothetical protein
MNKKPFFLLIFFVIVILQGCIKEYNMNKLSDKVGFSPSFTLSAVTGEIVLANIVDSGDTLRFDSDKFVRVVFRKDSVINFRLKDYYDLSNMVTFRKGYKVGDVSVTDYKDSIQIPLSSLSGSITPAPVNGTYVFPPFGPITLPNKTFSAFTSFQNAVFSSGTLTISVKNGLPTPLNSINITLFNNTVPITPLSGVLTIPAIPVGGTQSTVFNLAGKTLTNSITAAIVMSGSPGTAPNPVNVNLSSSFQVKVATSNLKVQSGRIVLPGQDMATLTGTDMLSFNPGSGVELTTLKVLTGRVNYNLVSSGNFRGSFQITFPKAHQGAGVVSKAIAINGPTNLNDTLSLTSADIDLSSDGTQPFNRMPMNYAGTINSNGGLINFNRNDSIYINMSMLNPNLDYARGYFGQTTEQIDPEVLDTGIDEIINSITGTFHISDPSIKLKYSNSFGIPMEVTLNATGKKSSQSVNLGLAPFLISYPAAPVEKVKKDSLIINKNNSSLPAIISLPPSTISFSGSAKTNPAGPNPSNRWSNYIYGNSKFLGNVEVEIPLQLWMNNIQFSDTVDNFLKLKSSDNSDIKPSDFDSLRINITVQNGFPLGASVKLMLYDPVKKMVLRTIDGSSLLLPAPVDGSGKSTGSTESTTTILFNKDFFDTAESAENIIFLFTLKTSGNGTTDVKIYSDNKLTFKASVMAKPNFKF